MNALPTTVECLMIVTYRLTNHESVRALTRAAYLQTACGADNPALPGRKYRPKKREFMNFVTETIGRQDHLRSTSKFVGGNCTRSTRVVTPQETPREIAVIGMTARRKKA